MLPSNTRNIFALVSGLILVGCNFEKEDFWYKSADEITFVQIDRIGLPYVYEIFFDDEDQAISEQLAMGDPSTDVKKLAPLLANQVTDFRATLASVSDFPSESSSAKTADDVADLLTPNVLTIDLRKELKATTFNGFSLQKDDAFDAMVALYTGRVKMNDGVQEEESETYKKSFPYLSHQNY